MVYIHKIILYMVDERNKVAGTANIYDLYCTIKKHKFLPSFSFLTILPEEVMLFLCSEPH